MEMKVNVLLYVFPSVTAILLGITVREAQKINECELASLMISNVSARTVDTGHNKRIETET